MLLFLLLLVFSAAVVALLGVVLSMFCASSVHDLNLVRAHKADSNKSGVGAPQGRDVPVVYAYV